MLTSTSATVIPADTVNVPGISFFINRAYSDVGISWLRSGPLGEEIVCKPDQQPGH